MHNEDVPLLWVLLLQLVGDPMTLCEHKQNNWKLVQIGTASNKGIPANAVARSLELADGTQVFQGVNVDSSKDNLTRGLSATPRSKLLL